MLNVSFYVYNIQ